MGVVLLNTAAEVSTSNNGSSSVNQLKVHEILVTTPDNVPSGKVSLQYLDQELPEDRYVSNLVFNTDFSKYLKEFKDVSGLNNFVIKLTNLTKKTTLLGTVTNISNNEVKITIATDDEKSFTIQQVEVDDELIIDLDFSKGLILTIDSISDLRNLKEGTFEKKVNTLGYYTKADGGGTEYYFDETSTEADDGATVIKLDALATGRFKLLPKNTLDAKVFGAYSSLTVDQQPALQKAIDYCGENNIHLIVSGLGTDTGYLIEDTVTFSYRGLNVSFVGGAYLKPVDEMLLNPVFIGGTNQPTRMFLSRLKVDRVTYNDTTENCGFTFLECNQSTFEDFESRESKYNTYANPTTGGFAYNLFDNLQNVGGFYNIYMKADGGFANENKFVGGRCFGRANLDTHVYLDGGEVNHNTFLSMSAEGAGNQAFYINAGSNVIMYPRTEGSWVNGSIVLTASSIFNTVFTTRYDGTITDNNYPNGRNQIISYTEGIQSTTAVNGKSTYKGVRLGASLDNPAFSFHDVDSASGNDYIAEFMHSRETTDSYVFKSIRKIGNLVRAYLKTSGILFLNRGLEIGNSSWNLNPFKMGIYRFWFDSKGQLRYKTSAPTSETDGTPIVENAVSIAIGFNNAANVINVNKKYKGKMVYDDDTNRPVFADGSLATDVWRYADGTIAYTPV